MKKAIFAGPFDPFTIGHMDVLRRAAVLRRSCRLPHAGAQSGRIRIHAVTLSRSGTDAPRTELPQGSG